jgi:hypothetical protein
MDELTNAYGILVGKQQGSRPAGRLTRNWEDNITIDLREIGSGGMDWIDLAQDRVQRWVFVNMVMNLLRSQWRRGLRHEMSSRARTLGSWIRIPLKARIFVCVYSV